jgi:hypothetical protein
VFNWGVVTKVTFPGVNMDIGHVRNPSWSKSNDESQWANYNRLRGQYMSALEAAVPERFFSDPAQCNPATSTTTNPALPNCPQGISAVKALQIAAQAGQRIYTITPEVFQNNPNIVSGQLNQHSADTQDRVQNYLQAGYEVSIHQSPITQDGWSGAGFIVIDQATGAGAYLIEGGSNGAWLNYVAGALLSFFVVPFALLSAGVGIATILISGALLIYSMSSFIKTINEILAKVNLTSEQKSGSIKLISALTVLGNLFSAYKIDGKSSAVVFSTLMAGMLATFSLALDWIISLYESIPTIKINE